MKTSFGDVIDCGGCLEQDHRRPMGYPDHEDPKLDPMYLTSQGRESGESLQVGSSALPVRDEMIHHEGRIPTGVIGPGPEFHHLITATPHLGGHQAELELLPSIANVSHQFFRSLHWSQSEASLRSQPGPS